MLLQLQNIAFILKKDGTWSSEIKSTKSIYNTVFLPEMMLFPKDDVI